MPSTKVNVHCPKRSAAEELACESTNLGCVVSRPWCATTLLPRCAAQRAAEAARRLASCGSELGFGVLAPDGAAAALVPCTQGSAVSLQPADGACLPAAAAAAKCAAAQRHVRRHSAQPFTCVQHGGVRQPQRCGSQSGCSAAEPPRCAITTICTAGSPGHSASFPPLLLRHRSDHNKVRPRSMRQQLRRRCRATRLRCRWPLERRWQRRRQHGRRAPEPGSGGGGEPSGWMRRRCAGCGDRARRAEHRPLWACALTWPRAWCQQLGEHLGREPGGRARAT